ncbi:dephospho-CoA kinase [Buchnera aphidicola (Melanaphis sacchari)]|uniref:Dephospho-CoA kinase n=1 Tax=Buchnera aphidicola (Melanaphis sacchari) TaxID=2173854 RepID=A0A2U8DFV8_9GAMM|nr:dephospho-CoA kinase [Buchnera aphidicola]AWH90567.1 dephospho-CoA kinase [Buchnera aphidicola (Melanaphis sacchari)]
MTYIVALTGGIGSGKTIISNSFKKQGIHIVDTDVIAKKIVEKNMEILNNIKKKFGKKILNLDNSINRILLRNHVFSNKNNKLWLENILHPKIYEESKKQIKSTKSCWCLWVVPLLLEKKLEKKVNRILLIDTPVKTQIKRIIKRDKINIREAKKIISYQFTRTQRISISDDIIFNKNKKISTLNLYTYYLNKFYTYLSKKKYLIQIKKNNLTKFY